MLVLLLGGCNAAPEIAGFVAGSVTGGATGNPALGFAVGVGTVAAVDFVYKSGVRRWHRSEQDAIATAAGLVSDGAEADWRVRHDLPFGNEHGRLLVTRWIENPLADCKEVLFSVDDGVAIGPRYAVVVCRQHAGWKWANAEPAVERWGFLQ